MASSSNAARWSARKSGEARPAARGSKGAKTGKARLCAAISASRGRSTSIPWMKRQIPRGVRAKNACRSLAVSAEPGAARPAAVPGRASRVGEAQGRQEERVVKLLLGESRVLAGAERRHASADLVDQDVADLVHRLRLATRRRSGGGVGQVGVADVEPGAERALEQDRSGRFADLEDGVIAAQRERGLLAHRLRQSAID